MVGVQGFRNCGSGQGVEFFRGANQCSASGFVALGVQGLRDFWVKVLNFEVLIFLGEICLRT